MDTSTYLHGDMFTLLPNLDAASIDLALIDLPYGQTNCTWDTKVDLDRLWTELKRASKPNTAFIFFCTTRFGHELIAANPKWFRYDLVWDKQLTVGHLNAKKQPMRQHEMIYVFYDRQPTYDIASNHQIDGVIPRGESETAVYGKRRAHDKHSYNPPLPTSILRFDSRRASTRKHPTEKPIELYSWLIRYFSRPGDLVFDPCYGSGNSGAAAEALGRRYIGFELNPL